MSYGSSGDPFRRRKRKAKQKPKRVVDPWGKCDWKEVGGLSRDSMVEQGDVRLCIPYHDDTELYLGYHDSDPLSPGRCAWDRRHV